MFILSQLKWKDLVCCIAQLTEGGHEVEQVLESGRERALLVLLEAEVQRGVDDEAQFGNHLKKERG